MSHPTLPDEADFPGSTAILPDPVTSFLMTPDDAHVNR